MTTDNLRKDIEALVDKYCEIAYAEKPFEPSKTGIPASGKVIGAPEINGY